MKTFFENVEFIFSELEPRHASRDVHACEWLITTLGRCCDTYREDSGLQGDVEAAYDAWSKKWDELLKEREREREGDEDGYTYSDYGCDAPQDSIDAWADRMRSDRRELGDI